MPTAYLFIHIRAKTAYKPNITIHHPISPTPPADIPHWTQITGTLPSQPPQPDKTITIHISTKKQPILDCAGPFTSFEDAEKAAQSRCLEFLAEKWLHEGRVDISWKKSVSTKAGKVRESTYARTFGPEHLEKHWWEIVEVEVDV